MSKIKCVLFLMIIIVISGTNNINSISSVVKSVPYSERQKMSKIDDHIISSKKTKFTYSITIFNDYVICNSLNNLDITDQKKVKSMECSLKEFFKTHKENIKRDQVHDLKIQIFNNSDFEYSVNSFNLINKKFIETFEINQTENLININNLAFYIESEVENNKNSEDKIYILNKVLIFI